MFIFIFIFNWSSKATGFIAEDVIVVIVVTDVVLTVVILVDVDDFVGFTVDIMVGSVTFCEVVIVVGDVNEIVGGMDFIVVIVVGDCRVVTVVPLLSFLLL